MSQEIRSRLIGVRIAQEARQCRGRDGLDFAVFLFVKPAMIAGKLGDGRDIGPNAGIDDRRRRIEKNVRAALPEIQRPRHRNPSGVGILNRGERTLNPPALLARLGFGQPILDGGEHQRRAAVVFAASACAVFSAAGALRLSGAAVCKGLGSGSPLPSRAALYSGVSAPKPPTSGGHEGGVASCSGANRGGDSSFSSGIGGFSFQVALIKKLKAISRSVPFSRKVQMSKY